MKNLGYATGSMGQQAFNFIIFILLTTSCENSDLEKTHLRLSKKTQAPDTCTPTPPLTQQQPIDNTLGLRLG